PHPGGGARAPRALRPAGPAGRARPRRGSAGGARAAAAGNRQPYGRGAGALAGPERQGVSRRTRSAVNIGDRTSARFERLAARLGAHRPWAPAFHERYWEAVRELFTRDVTGEGLRELLQRETQDTFHFFTREVPLDDLKGRPFWERWPQAVWRTFLAPAYRPRPWPRVGFAFSVPLLALAWVRWIIQSAAAGDPIWSIPPLLLLGATALFFLLALELRDKLGLKGDLEVARQIQFGLLPFEPFTQDGFDVRCTMRPANTVGGDYFDLLDIRPGRLAVVVGGVASKGMAAAPLIALTHGNPQ